MSAFKKKADIIKNSTKLAIDVNQSTINELKRLIHDKLIRIRSILQSTLRALNSYKELEIISNSDVIVCTTTLIECFEKTTVMLSQLETTEQTVDSINSMIDQLQQIIDKLSIIMCGYGTASIEDVFFISFGSDLDVSTIENPIWRGKCELILKNVRPIGYKTVHWKQARSKPRHISEQGHTITVAPICSNKIVEEVIQLEMANQFECFDIDFTGKPTYVKIHGIRAVVHNEKTQKTLIIQGIIDDIPLDCVHNDYVAWRKHEILTNIPQNGTFQPDIMKRIVDTMTIKDVLISGNEDVYKKHIAILSEVNYVKFNKLNTTIKKFLDMDTYGQRAMLINLLIYNREDDIQYITYLLYDLISAKSTTQVDSAEQQLMYDSFPWRVKLFFKETMKNTMKYTKDMISKYDINRISLEQQIYVMKVPENVREKAMAKLKEIKGKSDDTGAKAKQYLEGLLKIPFNVYREEPSLKKPKIIHNIFSGAIDKIDPSWGSPTVSSKKSHYTAMEVSQTCNRIFSWIKTCLTANIDSTLDNLNMRNMNLLFKLIADSRQMAVKKTTTPKQDKIDFIREQLPECDESAIVRAHDIVRGYGENSGLSRVWQDLKTASDMTKELNPELENIARILDDSIHGHEHAKNQILKIVSQWMNGEQSGYCFGFEGSPGIGKTSLAKRGLAKCLNDANGESRPFAFIALGGSCNGSTLEGHSYTYVNSTWGRIVDVLMDSKCMNPIIYIDELDKVSKTEHGKEIIGILMHLIDTTQNSGFQDKYFSGIDIDLSKALFIFSYNDPAQIDSILLDRIHRIRFDNLSMDEKLVIVRKYMLPEITRKMGLEGCVELSDDVITHIIECYTLESGVRKLKEVMFDLYGEINVELLKCNNPDSTVLPIVVNIADLETKYLTKYDKIVEKKIHDEAEVGVINGLWANALGRGGIIPIQTMYFPSNSFLDLKLTGLQGDVMKESMTVAKSLAWSLLDDDQRAKCLASFDKTKEQGLHIHCPDGAVSKDGPSAGAAITVAIYSLLSGKPINPKVAMTGEVNLQGRITEIGGLEHKILGGIRAGVRKFLYPVGNKSDFDKFMKKMEGKSTLNGVEFVPVSKIDETFVHFFDNECVNRP